MDDVDRHQYYVGYFKLLSREVIELSESHPEVALVDVVEVDQKDDHFPKEP